MKQITTSVLKEMKRKSRPIAMVTAYDYPTSKLAAEAGVDMLLVGDSLGMVVLGYDSTLPVTVDDMVHHTKAVTRGAGQTMVVADLPYLSYHGSFDRTLEACARLVQEGGTHAVKLEGGREQAVTVERLTKAGVPVMGHLGLTPQSVNQLGGYKVQAKDTEEARRLIDDAYALQQAGVFALVLECIPAPLARIVSSKLSIPTIGIGAGPDCDGQVLVFHDLVSYGSEIEPKFVKSYGQAGEYVRTALSMYVQEVRERKFPTEEHCFSMRDDVLEQLYGGRSKQCK